MLTEFSTSCRAECAVDCREMSDFDDSDDDLLVSACEGITESDTSLQALDLEIPDKFAFPFEPYDIQVGFMQHMFKSLALGKLGIFESPTGTGKSLSLICGALTWLKKFEEDQRQELERLIQETQVQSSTKDSCEDWIAAFESRRENQQKSHGVQEKLDRRKRRDEKLKRMRNKDVAVRKRKYKELENEFDSLFKETTKELKEVRRELDGLNSDAENGSHDLDIVLEEYFSDDEQTDDKDVEEEEEHVTKIYFCSRTHSQLTQFVREVKKSPFGGDTRVVSIGSRQNMCVNDTVKKLGSLSLINDRCLEMQKSKSESKNEAKKRKTVGACPYYKQDTMNELKDQLLVDIQDIEELSTAGKQMKACPYYSTRYAIPEAQLVALPYNTLLHKSTREACGIKLAGNVVVIDEAHNLLETINSVYSVQISGAEVTRAHSQLVQYEEKYRSRLKAKNLMYIKQLVFVLKSLLMCLGGRPGVAADEQHNDTADAVLWTINDFLFKCQIDNLNIFKLIKYCEKSQISRKLQGFVEKYNPSVEIKVETKVNETPRSRISQFLSEITSSNDKSCVTPASPACDAPEEDNQCMRSPLMHIEGFIEALTNADKDGRIVISKQGLVSRSSLKFVLLNPAVHFADILHQARAVIVAGGTMQPVSEFKDQLFIASGIKPDRILEYSCGHVIPPDHLLPISLSTGPTGVKLDFTYQSRKDKNTLEELGRVMTNVCCTVPAGVVCFVPSYDYAQTVYTYWESTGFINRMSAKKKIFREPKKSSQVDKILLDYAREIERPDSSGALLLCVVGGKMSEGINFSDDLGRCVVMIGLPYPNIHSPELKEKMDYLNKNVARGPDGKLPGQVYYENICMKSVNQSIGRAIRHRGDYACILLLDYRYLRASTVAQLPGWISKHLRKVDQFGGAISAIRQFFNAKKR